MTDNTPPEKPRGFRLDGTMVVVMILIGASTLGLFSAMFAYQTRWRVQIENLDQRVQELETRLGIETSPLPTREFYDESRGERFPRD